MEYKYHIRVRSYYEESFCPKNNKKCTKYQCMHDIYADFDRFKKIWEKQCNRVRCIMLHPNKHWHSWPDSVVLIKEVGSSSCRILWQDYVMLYAIWYHLHNLKNVKNTHGGKLLLVACNFTKSNNPPWFFFRFLKLNIWYQIALSTTCSIKVFSFLVFLVTSILF